MIDYRVGDVFARMADIPDGTVSLVASSPPFIALRSYLPDDHPDKALEIGSEPDPATFLDTLLRLTAEWGRVLAPWGSVAIELGDTYAGSGGAGGDYNEGGLRDGQQRFKQSGWAGYDKLPYHGGPTIEGYRKVQQDEADLPRAPRGAGTGWPRPKCLALIPQLYATSLAYGRNLLTGEPSPAGQWLVRNVIVWHRPNPAVGALGDKVRPSTSYITVATRSPKRWFDLTAVRTPFTGHAGVGTGVRKGQNGDKSEDNRPDDLSTRFNTHAGAPPLDCWFDEHDTWTLTTSPSSLAHYAMWPPRLAERLILMMCPEQVCATCGEPRRRIEGTGPVLGRGRTSRNYEAQVHIGEANKNGRFRPPDVAVRDHLGWSDCGHNNYEPGRVLDPFAGTGTSLAVAELHGRDSIGIDLDSRNRELLPRRMEECKRVLYGTQPELPGQQNLFAEATS